MKFVSTMALGLALALGTATVTGAPALAAKEKKAKAPQINISAKAREPLAAAQKALAAGDNATAAAQLAAAKAVASKPDDNLFIGQMTYDLGTKTSNSKLQAEGLEMMAASGMMDEAQKPTVYLVLGQIAYQAKDFAKAESWLTQAMNAGATDPNGFALLVETKNQNGKTGEALETLEAAIAKQKAAGQAVPNEWYGRGLSIALASKAKDPATQAKVAAATGRIAESWISAYPTKTNWRDTLIIYRDVNKIDADQELDLWRLMRTAGALNGERDYMDYVQATYLKFPAEAKAVLEEGQAAGFVNLKAGNAKEIYDIVKGKIAADKASLTKTASSGKAALSTGDAYLGYNDWATAADLYKQALAKGGVDANTVNLRLGMALARAGQKDAAKQAFGQVTGPRAGLARYWTIYLDKSAA